VFHLVELKKFDFKDYFHFDKCGIAANVVVVVDVVVVVVVDVVAINPLFCFMQRLSINGIINSISNNFIKIYL